MNSSDQSLLPEVLEDLLVLLNNSRLLTMMVQEILINTNSRRPSETSELVLMKKTQRDFSEFLTEIDQEELTTKNS